MVHATTIDLRPHLDRRRAATPPGRAALRRCVHRAPRSDPVGQRLRTAARIAGNLGCTAVSVRNAIHAFAALGLDCLQEKSCRPKTAKPLLVPDHADELRLVLHLSPRLYGFHRSTWTLGLIAQVCHQRGWAPRVLSIEAVRQAVGRLGVSWQRAKHWITSPDPAIARKKKRATG